MKLLSTITVLLLAAVSYGLYQLSFQVEALQDRAATLDAQIVTDKDAISVLEAEWALLNNPRRLEQLSNRFLELTPTEPMQIKTIDDLAVRTNSVNGAAFIDPELAPAPLPAGLPLDEGIVGAPDLDDAPAEDMPFVVHVVPAAGVRSSR